MTLREYMTECELFKSLPLAIIRTIALNEYLVFEKTLEEWYNDENGEFGSYSVSDIYVHYANQREEATTNLKPLMEKWWKKSNLWSEDVGEDLNNAIRHYYLLEKSDTPESKIPELSLSEFLALFENDFIAVPVPGFYDIFNRANHTLIRFEANFVPKNFLFFGKKKILNKVRKNKYLVIYAIYNFMRRAFSGCAIDGKTWEQAVIDLVRDRVSDALEE